MRITRRNADAFCRTCLNELKKQTKSGKVQVQEKFNILQLNHLTELLRLCISQAEAAVNNDGYPKFICQSCYDELQRFHSFRIRSMHSMHQLEQLLHNKELVTYQEEMYVIEHLTPSATTTVETTVAKERHQQQQEDLLNDAGVDNVEIDSKPPQCRDKRKPVTRNRLPRRSRRNENACESILKTTDSDAASDIKTTAALELLDADAKSSSESTECKEEEIDNLNTNMASSNNSLHERCDTETSSDAVKEAVETSLRENSNDSHEQAVAAESTTGEAKIASDAAYTNGKKRAIYQCEHCPRRCMSEANLEAHKRIHQGLKPFQCEKCERSFNKPCRLRQHVREVHDGQQANIVCKYEGCGKVFRRDATYKIHYQLKHLALKKRVCKTYLCEECGSTFKNITKLKEHRYKHSPLEDYPYQCEHCNKRFCKQHTYKEHLKRHSGIKNFVCPHCGLRKTTRRELRTHLNYHTKERQWHCKLCPMVFNSSANMGMHDRVVHKGIRRYACRYCDQSFGKSDTLKHHEMRHTGEKPHACTECGKRFIQVVALRAHMKTHNRSNPSAVMARAQLKLRDMPEVKEETLPPA